MKAEIPLRIYLCWYNRSHLKELLAILAQAVDHNLLFSISSKVLLGIL